jgi:hypothetical protein
MPAMLRTTKGFALVAALVLCAACGKKADETTATDAGAAVPTPEAPTDAGAATGEVATYPNQIPQGGTKITRVSFQVRQAADPNSKLLTTLGPGTAINLKASFSSWMLIDWPSGVGQLSPGWINLDRNDASKVADAPPLDAGAAAVDAAVPDAAAPVDAGTDGRAVRPTIKIRPKK